MRSANPTLRFDDKTNLGSGHTEIYKALRGFGLVRSFGALLILPTRAMRVTFVLDCIWLTSPCSYPVRDLPRKRFNFVFIVRAPQQAYFWILLRARSQGKRV